MLPPISERASAALRGALLVAAAGACLSGCALKNPFASPDTSEAVTTSGVQTSKERRFLGVFSPYRVTIQQGNFVSREMVAQLKEGMQKGAMTPDQVRFVMGTPLLTDIFHKDRWDYPFRIERGNGDVITSHITLRFENNRLARIEGGDLPTEKEYLSLIAGKSAPRPATELPPVAPAAVPATK